MIKTFQNSLTKTIFNKTTCFEYFFVILQRMIYKKIMTVSRQFPLIHVKKIIRFMGTKMFNRWYTHSIGLKHLQSETLPQKPQSLISCWKPCSAPNFLLCSAVSMVAHKDKHFPDCKTLPIQKHFPESKTRPSIRNTSQNPKAHPAQNPKSHPRIQNKQRLKFVNKPKPRGGGGDSI